MRSKASERIAADKSAGMNARRRMFVAEYLVDKNATNAAIRAGYSEKTAKQIGSKLLTEPAIAAAVADAQAQQIDEVVHATGITLERVLRQIAKSAFFDVRRLLDADGNPLPLDQLDDDTAASIAGLDVDVSMGKNADGERSASKVLKYKLAERKTYLDMLMKHLGGYKVDNEQKLNPLTEMLASMQRSALPVVPDVPELPE